MSGCAGSWKRVTCAGTFSATNYWAYGRPVLADRPSSVVLPAPVGFNSVMTTVIGSLLGDLAVRPAGSKVKT